MPRPQRSHCPSSSSIPEHPCETDATEPCIRDLSDTTLLLHIFEPQVPALWRTSARLLFPSSSLQAPFPAFPQPACPQDSFMPPLEHEGHARGVPCIRGRGCMHGGMHAWGVLCKHGGVMHGGTCMRGVVHAWGVHVWGVPCTAGCMHGGCHAWGVLCMHGRYMHGGAVHAGFQLISWDEGPLRLSHPGTLACRLSNAPWSMATRKHRSARQKHGLGALEQDSKVPCPRSWPL